MDWNPFGILFSDLFAVDIFAAGMHEFVTTKALRTLVAERGIGLIPYLARHLAGNPGEVSEHDTLSDVYRCVTARHGHYSAFSVTQDVRVIFASSHGRRVTFVLSTFQVTQARR